MAAAANCVVLSDDDSINDPPSPALPRLPSLRRGLARANLLEVRRRLVDHAAALFPEPNPPAPAPEVLANDAGGPPPAPLVKVGAHPGDFPVDGNGRGDGDAPPIEAPSPPPSPGGSISSSDSIWLATDHSPFSPEGMRAWAHYNQNSRFMNRLPPYF